MPPVMTIPRVTIPLRDDNSTRDDSARDENSMGDDPARDDNFLRNGLHLNRQIDIQGTSSGSTVPSASIASLASLEMLASLIYHHFRQHVRDGLISIYLIDTEEQLGDIFTKPLPQKSFQKHRKRLLKF